MKTSRKIKVTFSDGSKKYIFATTKKIKAHKNVIEYVKNRFSNSRISEIKTRSFNEHTKKYYWDLNYNTFFELLLIVIG